MAPQRWGLPVRPLGALTVCFRYGEVVNINLVRDKKTGKSKGFCFLCYEDQRSTILAVDNFNGIKVSEAACDTAAVTPDAWLQAGRAVLWCPTERREWVRSFANDVTPVADQRKDNPSGPRGQLSASQRLR